MQRSRQHDDSHLFSFVHVPFVMFNPRESREIMPSALLNEASYALLLPNVRDSYIHIPAEYTLNISVILPVPRLTSIFLSQPPAST